MLLLQTVGNCGSDPEVRTSGAGNRYVRFSVAASIWDNGADATQWVSVTVFSESLCKQVMSRVHKGARVMVTGEAKFKASDKGGVFVDVVAAHFTVLNRSKDKREGGGAPSGGGYQASKPHARPKLQGGGGYGGDDLPFAPVSDFP